MGVLFFLFAVGLYIRFFSFPGVAFLQYSCSCAIGIQITKVPGGRIFSTGFFWRYASYLSLDLSPTRFLELCSNNAVHGASFEFQDILLLFWVPGFTIPRKH